MKPRVYVETSVFGYLTAIPSRDLVAAGRQALTREWWADAGERYELAVSQFVEDEAAGGDEDAAERRLAAIRPLTRLEVSEEARRLADRLVDEGAVPAAAANDASHIAVATVHGAAYLVTWNCRHIANANLFDKIAAVSGAAGYTAVTLCTPDLLLAAASDG